MFPQQKMMWNGVIDKSSNEYKNWKSKVPQAPPILKGEANPFYGGEVQTKAWKEGKYNNRPKPHQDWKGRTLEEILGGDKAAQMKKNMSKPRNISPNRNRKEEISKFFKEYWKKHENPMKNIHLNGKLNPNYKGGKFESCPICGKPVWVVPIARDSAHCCSMECSKKWRKMSYRGDGNPNWRDGIGKEPYSFDFDNKLKYQIKVRDNFTCQLCSYADRNKLATHHIDYDKENSNPNNLITLCRSCNGKVNANREYWQKYFIQLLEGRNASEIRLN